MRILILSSEFPPGPGGIGTHAYQLARHFSAQGHPSLVLTAQDYVDVFERETFNSIQPFQIVTLASGGRNALSKVIDRANSFKSALRDFNPDIVMVSGGRSTWLSAVVLHGRRIPWVVVGHGTEFGARFSLESLLTRFACNRADAVIPVSEFTRSMMTSIGINRPLVKVIHNGADAGFFHPLPPPAIAAFRERHNAAEKFILLTVGNVTPRKGQEWVIRALPAMLERRPDLVYWIAGLPSYRSELEEIAAGLGVSDHIHFWGRVDQDALLNLYNACDLFMMTSQQLKNGDFEGYGIAAIEAALCGKTSVVTDNSGLAEAILDQETGLLIPQGQAAPIAEAVIGLIDTPDLLRRLSQAAYTRALTQQTWAHAGEAYLRFFNQLSGKA